MGFYKSPKTNILYFPRTLARLNTTAQEITQALSENVTVTRVLSSYVGSAVLFVTLMTPVITYIYAHYAIFLLQKTSRIFN